MINGQHRTRIQFSSCEFSLLYRLLFKNLKYISKKIQKILWLCVSYSILYKNYVSLVVNFDWVCCGNSTNKKKSWWRRMMNFYNRSILICKSKMLYYCAWYDCCTFCILSWGVYILFMYFKFFCRERCNILPHITCYYLVICIQNYFYNK